MKHNFSLIPDFLNPTLRRGADSRCPGGHARTTVLRGSLHHRSAPFAPRKDVEAFVQCAYEFVQEVGFEEARRAFNEDERWKSGPTYVFVDEVTPMKLDMSRAFVFPPDPSLEGQPWGPLIDAFGDYYEELYRVMSAVDEGWIYYAFRNPATGREEPKASYVKSIDWDGNPAAIGAGIYRRDHSRHVQRVKRSTPRGLDADPSKEKLQEFVRCAAMELESQGYFAVRSLIHRSALGERLDLPVRRWTPTATLSVQRRSFTAGCTASLLPSWIDLSSTASLRRSGSRKCGGRVRGILPLLLDAVNPSTRKAGSAR